MGWREGLVHRARASRELALRPLRRGSRSIIWPPHSGLGFSNYLYFCLRARNRQLSGEDVRVLTPAAVGPWDRNPWLELLPRIRRELTVNPDGIRFTDRREAGAAIPALGYAVFGDDYTRDQLHGFVRDYLVPEPLIGEPRVDPTTVTLHVRRGDYYSEPHFRGAYGFDVPAYVEVALHRAAETGGPIRRLRVVTNGVDWCRLKLDSALRAAAPQVDYVSSSEDPRADFRTLATSQRIIGTNSTFSYWGGYISNVLYGVGSQVIVPRFHARMGNSSDAYQIDPRWEVVETIPGGWDA